MYYKDYWLKKLLNKIFYGGGRNQGYKNLRKVLIKNKFKGINFKQLLWESLEILRVPLGLKRITKRNYAPIKIIDYYQYIKSLHWLVLAIRENRSKKSIYQKIIEEILLVVRLEEKSNALKKKKSYEKLLYKNRFYKNYF